MVMDATDTDEESVVGDECHIASRKPGGPRGNVTDRPDDADACENLILLCKVCHKLVDDQEREYGAGRLREIKVEHEKWVAVRLRSEAERAGDAARDTEERPDGKPVLLPRVASGRELFALLCGCDASRFDHDDLRHEGEVELVGGFLQNAQDWGDIADAVEPMHAVRTRFQLDGEIDELERSGFLVFGERRRQRAVLRDTVIEPFNVAVLTVVRKDNPGIVSSGAHLFAFI